MHEKVGFFDQEGCNFADDWEMWLRAVDDGAVFKKINEIVFDQLEALLAAAQSEMKKNDMLIQKAKNLVGEASGLGYKGEAYRDLMQTPEMLSSVITAIIAKHGDVRLGPEDFAKMSSDEYVSVYVDTRTKDLILSLKSDLALSEAASMANFGNPDDNTYH